MRVYYTLAVLANSEPVSVSGHSPILCGGLRLRNHRAVAENYNFIARFSDFACLVAVCFCFNFVVHCQRGVHYSFPILGAGIRYMIKLKTCL